MTDERKTMMQLLESARWARRVLRILATNKGIGWEGFEAHMKQLDASIAAAVRYEAQKEC